MIRRERRDGGEGEERGLKKGAERDREKRDKIGGGEGTHLPLVVVQLLQGTGGFPTRFCSKALQHLAC